MDVKVMPVGMIGTNCYVLSKGEEAIIVDPGGDADKILSYVKENNLTVISILLTHAHYDHIGAVEEVRNETGAKVYLHETESEWLTDPRQNGSYRWKGMEVSSSPADVYLEEGSLQLHSFQFEVIHTPGHSPGSVSFICADTMHVFSGDVLFREGIGRTDLVGGNMETLKNTIINKMYTLDDSYRVYPGHGPSTTIGHEKMNNPFFRLR